jgi:hypothetical protein
MIWCPLCLSTPTVASLRGLCHFDSCACGRLALTDVERSDPAYGIATFSFSAGFPYAGYPFMQLRHGEKGLVIGFVFGGSIRYFYRPKPSRSRAIRTFVGMVVTRETVEAVMTA